MDRYNSAFLVVLYGVEASASNTLISLINSNVHFENVKLVIHNNGPEKISLCPRLEKSLTNLGFDTTLVQTLNNESLAVIYNGFIKNFDSKRYIVLDHDSELSKNYIYSVDQITTDNIGIPVIMANNAVHSPKVNGELTKNLGKCNKKDEIIAIGSGLIIGQTLANRIKFKFGCIFDDKFYLYGVDFTFLKRFNSLNISDHAILVPGFNHDLSRLEEGNHSKFRIKERGYDKGLTIRFYSKTKFALFYSIIKVTIRGVLDKLNGNNRLYHLPDVYKAVFLGKHYRDR